MHYLNNNKNPVIKRALNQLEHHNPRALEFLFGNLLEDSYCRVKTSKINLEYKHTQPQLDYVQWKHSFLSN